jgi:hypothetical protein
MGVIIIAQAKNGEETSFRKIEIRGGFFFHFSIVAFMFPMSSHYVP